MVDGGGGGGCFGWGGGLPEALFPTESPLRSGTRYESESLNETKGWEHRLLLTQGGTIRLIVRIKFHHQ